MARAYRLQRARDVLLLVEPPPHALGHIEVEQVLIRLGFHLDDVSFHELFDEVDGDGDGHSTSTMKPRPNP